jgi:hypothetical protein
MVEVSERLSLYIPAPIQRIPHSLFSSGDDFPSLLISVIFSPCFSMLICERDNDFLFLFPLFFVVFVRLDSRECDISA